MFKNKTSRAASRLLRQLQPKASRQSKQEQELEPFKQDYLSQSECHRTYSCIHCRAHLANHDELISKLFQGNHGRAYLFNKVVNVGCKQAVERELLTGLHAVADIYCDCCETTLGWKYEQAFVPSQKYKEGKYIIELVHMLKENQWDLTSYNSKELLEAQEAELESELQLEAENRMTSENRGRGTRTVFCGSRNSNYGSLVGCAQQQQQQQALGATQELTTSDTERQQQHEAIREPILAIDSKSQADVEAANEINENESGASSTKATCNDDEHELILNKTRQTNQIENGNDDEYGDGQINSSSQLEVNNNSTVAATIGVQQ